MLGFLEAALEHYGLSLELKEAGGDLQGQAITHGNLGRTYQRLGQLSRAREHFERDLELSLTLRDQEGVLMMRSHLAGLLREQFRFEESVRAYQDYLRQARDYRLARHVAFGHLGLAQVQTALGLYDQAEKNLAEANREAGRPADLFLRTLVLRAGGDLAAARGEAPEALNLYRLSAEALEGGKGAPAELVETLCQMARVHVREGQTAEAEERLRQAEEAVRANGLRWLRGRVNGLRHRLLSRGDRPYQRPEMPFPLAVAAGRVDRAEDAPERLRHLIELFKALLKYATTLALAYYQPLRPRLTPGEADAALLRTFDQQRPSLGKWAEGLRTALQVLAEYRDQLPEPLIVDVFAPPAGKRCRLRPEIQDRISRLLAVRNKLTHSGWPQDHADALRLADEITPDLEAFARDLTPLWAYRMLACQRRGGAALARLARAGVASSLGDGGGGRAGDGGLRGCVPRRPRRGRLGAADALVGRPLARRSGGARRPLPLFKTRAFAARLRQRGNDRGVRVGASRFPVRPGRERAFVAESVVTARSQGGAADGKMIESSRRFHAARQARRVIPLTRT